jgi:dCTP deaminase
MTDRAIEEAIETGELVIREFAPSGLQGASYDMRIGHEVLVSNTEAVVDPQISGPVRIQPGEFVLLTTLERVKLSANLAGNIGGKTYFTRKGLILLLGLQIDPGFEGSLALAAYNSSPKSIVLEYGEKICSVQFFRLRACQKGIRLRTHG